MNTVCVNASKNYTVIISENLLNKLGSYMLTLGKFQKVAIISDSNVWEIYGNIAETSLLASGIECCHFVFDAGEASKNGTTYLSILDFLAQNKLTRSDCLVALGGGVVGDITGFAAATYLRGIPYVQIPTTLLAMVDSSVGGKTAIDLPSGKNLAGAFYQPSLVLCDICTLASLPIDIFRDGCAEVIKYGILYDTTLFSHLAEKGFDFNRMDVITRCIELKRDVVAQDEFDTGARQKLNLGHTIGHGIEAQSNFTISHGSAVAIGMDIVTKAGVSFGICSTETYLSIHSLLETFQLPTATTCQADTLYHFALSDKKRSGGSVNLIIPQKIGDCIIRATPISELQTFIEAGLS